MNCKDTIEKMNKIEILNFLSNYKITENDIITDFNDYLEAEIIERNIINYSNVNDYIMGCYYDVFDNLDTIDNIDACILKDELLTAVEYIIYDNFNIKEV